MGQYLGMPQLASTFNITLLTKDGSNTPKDGAVALIYRVYGPSGIMQNGTGSGTFKQSGVVTGASNAAPISITSVGHGLTTGTRVTVASVAGNTAANGDFSISVVDPNTFTLDGSTGNGAYTSGGTWHVSGLYTFSVSLVSSDGYASGTTYTVYVSASVGGTQRADVHTFSVV